MKGGIWILLIITVLLGGGYFYHVAQAVCPVPIEYSIGELDGRFDLSREEARLALAEAESVWEDATGKNLFSYVEEASDLTVHFVFDERQEFVEAEGQLKERLDATEHISEAIGETYATLVAQYNDLRITYADRVESYEEELARYNAQVEQYNSQGGAPEEAYQQLEAQKEALNEEQKELNAMADELNALVGEINNVGDRGNKLIDTYNAGVNVYNKTFGEAREFTQGDYSDNVIKIYTFEEKDELKLVLLHEFGHALWLDHVEGEDSIMYYLIGNQNPDAPLTEHDLQEFGRVCGSDSVWDKLKLALSL